MPRLPLPPALRLALAALTTLTAPACADLPDGPPACWPDDAPLSGDLARDLPGTWREVDHGTDTLLTFTADGRWREQRLDSPRVRGGHYTLDDRTLTLRDASHARAEHVTLRGPYLTILIPDESGGARYRRVRCEPAP